jgi:hypothetical protein
LDFWPKEDRVGNALNQHSTDGSQTSDASQGFWSIEVKLAKPLRTAALRSPMQAISPGMPISTRISRGTE